MALVRSPITDASGQTALYTTPNTDAEIADPIDPIILFRLMPEPIFSVVRVACSAGVRADCLKLSAIPVTPRPTRNTIRVVSGVIKLMHRFPTITMSPAMATPFHIRSF